MNFSPLQNNSFHRRTHPTRMFVALATLWVAWPNSDELAAKADSSRSLQ